MMYLITFVVAFFFAEGVWTAFGGQSIFHRRNRHRALNEDIEERAKRVHIAVDRLGNRNRHLRHDGTRNLRSGKKILRALSDGRVRRD